MKGTPANWVKPHFGSMPNQAYLFTGTGRPRPYVVRVKKSVRRRKSTKKKR